MTPSLNSSVLFSPTSIYTGYGGTVTTFSSAYMTTQFTPAPSCSTRDWTLRVSYPNTVQAMWDYEFNNTKTLNPCSDSAFVSSLGYYNYYDEGRPKNTAFFQNGPITGLCPAGYVTVATRTPGSVDAYYIYDSTNPVQIPWTEAWCCPQGYTAQLTHSNPHFSTDASFTCNSFVSATATVSVAIYEGYPTASIASFSSKVISSFTAQDRGYHVRWNSQQIPFLQPSEARPVSTSVSGVISFAKEPSSTSDTNGGGDSGSGDSYDSVPYLGPRFIGAIVGSVLGAVLSISLSAICLYHRRRKARKLQATAPKAHDAPNAPTVNLTPFNSTTYPAGTAIPEMESTRQISEIAPPDHTPVHELSSSLPHGGDPGLTAKAGPIQEHFELPAPEYVQATGHEFITQSTNNGHPISPSNHVNEKQP